MAHAGIVRRALVRYLNWDQTLVVPEFHLDNAQCDVVQISRADYATEFEIKISRSDWNADQKKRKWLFDRPHISRFFYVVPESILSPIPEWVPANAGILIWNEGIREHRAAKRLKAQKVPAHIKQKAYEAFYFRYWRHENAMAEVRAELREQRRTCPRCFRRLKCVGCANALAYS